MKVSKNTYTVHELADLSGLSIRTLHYYDEIGLLQPKRLDNNYRCYASTHVDRLQQILLYREIGIELSVIKSILDEPSFDMETALKNHLAILRKQQTKLSDLIESVEKTLAYHEGKVIMTDTEKFEGFKKNLIDENEKKYGTEIREKYGDETIDASNAKMMGLTEDQYLQSQELESEMRKLLAIAFEQGDPASEEAQRACDLHCQWLCIFWKDGMYNKEIHMNMGEMYAADERFRAYYDKKTPGTAVFLREALKVYCKK